MKIAVTTAGGGLGSAIIEQLKSELPTENIIGLARTPHKAAHLGVDIRPGDYGKPEDLESSLQGVDAVLLVSSMNDPQERIGLHRNVISAAKNAGVKKIVYTSIFGEELDFGFNPIIASNRQTEADIRESGLHWVNGRNGLYIEPDVEYLDVYKKEGKIANSAGDGRCSYTIRAKLAFAYARMLQDDKHNGQTYTLCGQAITQAKLVEYFNTTFGIHLIYEPMSVAAYTTERQKELGTHMGTIIGGIYEGIRLGKMDVNSDYEKAAGRPHISWDEYFGQLR